MSQTSEVLEQADPAAEQDDGDEEEEEEEKDYRNAG